MRFYMIMLLDFTTRMTLVNHCCNPGDKTQVYLAKSFSIHVLLDSIESNSLDLLNQEHSSSLFMAHRVTYEKSVNCIQMVNVFQEQALGDIK